MELTIMTFNLRLDVQSDLENAWPYRAGKVADMILKHDPMIIGIQEGLHYMLTDLEERLGNYQWLGQGREGGNKGEFSAIFYKKELLTVVDTGQFWLSEQPGEPGSKSWGTACTRVCTWGHFQFLQEPDKEFSMYNTHLDHVSQEAREKGIQMILDIMCNDEQKAEPAFLTGDLNVPPENSVIKLLKGKEELVDAYSILEGDVGATFHDFLGGLEGQPIDYIFATKEVQLQNTSVDRSKVKDGFPSDHYPVILKASF